MPTDFDPEASQGRQPAFNAPWPVITLVALILGGFLLQGAFPAEAVGRWAFSSAGLAEGRWATLVTALFLHGNLAHALLNAAFALAFATPVVRSLGVRPAGLARFLIFYLACGVLANLAWAAAHPGDPSLLVGASGALSGLMAAAAQLIAGRGRPGRLLSRPVIGMAAAWIVVNLLVAVTGIAPGAGDATVAWEAHLAGFAAGLALFRPVFFFATQHDGQLH